MPLRRCWTSRRGLTTALTLACVLLPVSALAQGAPSTATLVGIVSDKDGVVPGATIEVMRLATGERMSPAVSNENGQYSFPALPPGTYIVTITMQNYKKAQVNVELTPGATQTIHTVLEVGQRTDVVTVDGDLAFSLIRMDTPTVSQTVNTDFIQTLPRNDRNALTFLIFLPGVTTIGGAINARFATTIAGLANDQFNITIDGITTDSLLNNQGVFSFVVPRLDAVEEMSLTTASAGADASGQGAIQIRFVTRSGTNKFETSLYWYLQHGKLNSNTYFNRLNGLPVPQATNQTFGGRIGGPIVLPHFDGRGRAFFFFNEEESYAPTETPRTRTIIQQSALAGNFCYGVTGAPTCVNVLSLAAANGQVSAVDPTVKSVLDAIRSATTGTGTITELVTAPNTAVYDYLVPGTGVRHSPTANVTVNVTSRNRLQGSYYWERVFSTQDVGNGAEARFPGFPAFGIQQSFRTVASISWRSTLSTSMVNEVRGGWQWSPVDFYNNVTPAMFENQGGYNLTLGFGLTAPAAPLINSPQLARTPISTIADQLNWLKGAHSVQFGTDYTHAINVRTDSTVVPPLTLGYQTNFDPAESMFTAANFPGSSTGDRNNAKALYAVLTGRVSSISGTGRLNDAGSAYVYNGPLTGREFQDDYSFYAQDVWRVSSTFTATLGARYQFTLPMNPGNSIFTTISAEDSCGVSGLGRGASADGATDRFCNMFQPGYLPNPTSTPKYVPYTEGNKGYHTDVNNVGPLGGISWRPNAKRGFWRAVLGDPELGTISGGFTRSFVRTQLTNFLQVYNANPGQTIPLTRSTVAGAFPLVLPGESWPILYSQKSRLGPPAFDPTPVFPIAAAFGNGAFNFNPDIQVPWTDSWNVSFQRSVTRDTVFEVRYQGNRSYKAWTQENWNATNVYETGWLHGEFELAEANLRANVLAGLGPTFKYTGIPGTSPLPIVLAHFNGRTDATNTSAYQGNIWSTSTFVSALDPFFPDPYGFASNLYLSSNANVAPGVQTRLFNNALAVGYPSNFWQANPAVAAIVVLTNSANRPLNHLVTFQLRRRLASGLAAQVSYTWQRNITGTRLDFHLPLLYLQANGVPHAIQALWTYDVPVGRGKTHAADMTPWLDGVVGGWTFSGTARFQRQSINVRNAVLVGMTVKEAQAALKVIRFVTDPVSGAVSVFNIPADIQINTRLAYNTDETQPTFYAPGTEPNGPAAMVGPDGVTYRYFAPAGGNGCNFIYTGDCGTPSLYFLTRWFGEMDFRLAKQFPLPGRARFEFSAEVFNATKALNFPTNFSPNATPSSFQIGSTLSGARTAQLV